MNRSSLFAASFGTSLAALSLGLVPVPPALAGPNAGGVVLLHANESIVYTTDVPDYCGLSEIGNCSLATTRTDAEDPVVLHALATFPISVDPRLAGITIGLEYDESEVIVLDWGECGDFELWTGGWPGPGEGSAITWSEAQTDYVIEFYWFAAYSYYGVPSEFALTGHPSGGGNFADDSVPSRLDVIADYGTFGFHTDGYLACPYPQPSTCTLEFVPSSIAVYQPCGGSFPVDLEVRDVVYLANFEVCTGYDGSLLQLDSMEIDPAFLGSTGRAVQPLGPVACDPTCQNSGSRFGAFTTGTQLPPSGDGVLAHLRFSPQSGSGGSDFLCLEDPMLTDHGVPPWDIDVVELGELEITHSAFCYGDFNGTGDVTALDLIQSVTRWNRCSGDSGYSGSFDLNLLERGNYCASFADGCIDVVDVQTVAGRWHLGCGEGAAARSPLADSTPSLRISPASSTVVAAVGDTFSVTLVVGEAEDLGAFEATVGFDPAVLEVESVETGDWPGSSGRTIYALGPNVDDTEGEVRLGLCTTGLVPGVDGEGMVARIVFRVETCDVTTDLTLGDVIITPVDGWPQELGPVTGASVEIDCDASGLPEGLPGVALFRNSPNPLTQDTEITFSLSGTIDERTQVRVAIYNAQGRLLRTLVDREFGTGVHTLQWDGRDRSGRELPSGTYFCRLGSEKNVLTRQILVLR